jgi:hypothetical protein
MVCIQPTLYHTVTPANYHSAVSRYHRPPSSGVQLFEQVGDNQLKVDAVGRPLPHLAAEKHTTGEAVYVDDMPVFRGTYFVFVIAAIHYIVSVTKLAAFVSEGRLPLQVFIVRAAAYNRT